MYFRIFYAGFIYMKKIKNRRKKRLIDKPFQLKTALIAIFISMLSFSIIILFILIASTASKNINIVGAVSDLERSVSEQDTLIQAFNEYSRLVKNPIFSLATEKITMDHRKSIGVIKDNIHILRLYTEHNNRFLILTIIVMALHAVVLFVFLIYFTSRVTGPAYAISQYINTVLKGKKINLKEMRDIRKNDELKSFFRDCIKLMQHKTERPKKTGRRKKTSVVNDDAEGENM